MPEEKGFRRRVSRILAGCIVMLIAAAGAGTPPCLALDIDGVSSGMTPEEVNETLGYYQLTVKMSEEFFAERTKYRIEDVYAFSSKYLQAEVPLFKDVAPSCEQQFLGIFSKDGNRLFSFTKAIRLPEETEIPFEEVLARLSGAFGPARQTCYNDDFGAHFAYWGYSVEGCPTYTPAEAVPDSDVIKAAYKGNTVYIILVDGKFEKTLRR